MINFAWLDLLKKFLAGDETLTEEQGDKVGHLFEYTLKRGNGEVVLVTDDFTHAMNLFKTDKSLEIYAKFLPAKMEENIVEVDDE